MASDATTSALGQPAEVDYPESDGQPMAETETHWNATVDLIQGFRDWYADNPLVYVSGDMFLYFVEGNPRRNVSPDVMVVHGVDKTVRATYKTWEEGGKAPDLVVEVSSKSTRREDLRQKLALYRDELRVREYFLFDPLGEYLKPPFRGFRLVDGQYEPIRAEEGRLPSEVLGLHLHHVGPTVRLFNPATGQIIPTRLEALAQVQRSNRRKGGKLRQQATALADRDMTIRERDMTIRERDMTIREQTAALAERDMTIREREMTIREQELTIGQKNLALGEARLTEAELRAEITRLRVRPEAD